MSAVLDRSFLESLTVPALCKFLNRRYVNQAVVQVVDDLRHIRFEEDLIRTYGVTGQECFVRRGDEATNVGQNLLLRFFHRCPRCKIFK